MQNPPYIKGRSPLQFLIIRRQFFNPLVQESSQTMKDSIVMVFVFLSAYVLMAVAQMSTPWTNPYFFYHYNAPLAPQKTSTDEMVVYNKHLSNYDDEIVSDTLGAHSLLISTCVAELRTTKADLKQTTQRLNDTNTEMESIKKELKGNSQLLQNFMANYENFTKIMNARTSDIVEIGQMPTSCQDLKRIGNQKNGFFSVMGQKKIQTVYCNFTREQTDQNFQSLIGYNDVKSSPVYFHAQRIATTSFLTANTVVPFDTFRTNVGNAMSSTGVFVAPKPGTYYFAFSALSASSVIGRVDLQMKNATLDWFKIGQAYGQATTETLTIQSTLQLKIGDQVRLLNRDGGLAEQNDANTGQWTHFVGFLLEEDIF